MPDERRVRLTVPRPDPQAVVLELLELKKVVDDYLHAITANRLRAWLRY